MLTVLGTPRHCCDGLTRRELLRAGALTLFGTPFLTPIASAAAARRPLAPARSVILIDLFGGPSHLDMFDLKPDAPSAIRGEFKPIATSLPGLRICEHLPQLARWMHRTCLIRTLSHGYNSHNPYAVMTGYTGGNDREDYFAKPSNHPSMGSVCQYLGVGRKQGLPGYIMLPAYPGYTQGLRRAGPYGGYLGSQYNPLFSTCDPTFTRPVDANKDSYDPTLRPMGDPGLPLPQGATLDALDRRRTLLEQMDLAASRLASNGMQVMTQRQQQAFELLLSPSAQKAFDLGKEPPALRDRYGRDLFGSSVLLARRLVEAGVTFLTIHTEARGNGHWDTHENNFNMLRHWLLPWLDQAVSALLDDLTQRGLLESTLVIVTGDMGRSPRVNGKAGRDHWPQCGFCLLAGGGVKQGMVHGASDRQGAFPLDHAVTPGDLVSTVYHLLGIDPETTVPDQTGRPTAISQGGKVIHGVLA
jgi:Protein of unknown function (DUF1501)